MHPQVEKFFPVNTPNPRLKGGEREEGEGMERERKGSHSPVDNLYDCSFCG
jgi:hypothetical protein